MRPLLQCRYNFTLKITVRQCCNITIIPDPVPHHPHALEMDQGHYVLSDC
jgi:hypothetical protein